jgi:hypothetical protein
MASLPFPVDAIPFLFFSGTSAATVSATGWYIFCQRCMMRLLAGTRRHYGFFQPVVRSHVPYLGPPDAPGD